MRKGLLVMILLPLVLSSDARMHADAPPAELRFKEDYLRRLVESVPDILRGQDPKTGRFGEGIWLVTISTRSIRSQWPGP